MSDKKVKQIEQEGNFTATITDVEIIKSRFKADDDGVFEVKITAGKRVDGEPAYCSTYLEISEDFLPSQMQRPGVETRAQETFARLAELGVPGNGMELAKAKQVMVKKTVDLFGKRNDKGHLNFYISSQRPEEVMDAAEAQAKVMALYGAGGSSSGEPGSDDPFFNGSVSTEGTDADVPF